MACRSPWIRPWLKGRHDIALEKSAARNSNRRLDQLYCLAHDHTLNILHCFVFNFYHNCWTISLVCTHCITSVICSWDFPYVFVILTIYHSLMTEDCYYSVFGLNQIDNFSTNLLTVQKSAKRKFGKIWHNMKITKQCK